MTGEARWYDQVRRVVLRQGGLCYHTHDSRRSEPGFPDLVIVVDGRVLFREVKLGSNQPTPAQLDWLERLIAAGQDAACWRFPADWPRALAELGLDTTPLPTDESAPPDAQEAAVGVDPAASDTQAAGAEVAALAHRIADELGVPWDRALAAARRELRGAC